MNVRFLENKEIYSLQVTALSSGLVMVSGELPKDIMLAGFEILTDKGKVYGNYQDYITIYRRLDDGSIIFSNDGSVWSPPDILDPMPEPEPTLEEVKAIKREEISTACEKIIYAGVSVELDGYEHFSLTEKDQLNLFGKQAQLAAGAERLEYHQDGHPCRYYTAEEMQIIITAAMEHVSYHTTYCNSINMWIASAESIEEVQSIYYGADVPEKYQSEVLQDYLSKIMGPAKKEVEEGAEET